jgi:hypothetical protein
VLRGARVALATAGLALLVYALIDNWSRSEALLRSPPRLAIAFTTILVALVLWANAWSVLVSNGRGSQEMRHGFYLSQLGKYVPGGVWQAAGIVILARDAGADLATATTGFGVLAIAQVAGAATVGGLAAIAAPGLSPLVRMAMVAGLGLVGLVHRRWMVWALDLVARRTKRVHSGAVPPQRAILRSYAWSVAATASAATSFVVILRPADAGVGAAAAAAFATAWWIGLVAVPFPSGIGIREGILVAVLHPIIGPGATLAAAVGQRLVSIVAELVLISATGGRRLQRRRTRRHDESQGESSA